MLFRMTIVSVEQQVAAAHAQFLFLSCRWRCDALFSPLSPTPPVKDGRCLYHHLTGVHTFVYNEAIGKLMLQGVVGC